MKKVKEFKEKTPKQISWASRVILKKMCEIIKENQENGKGSMADGYIASLILRGHNE